MLRTQWGGSAVVLGVAEMRDLVVGGRARMVGAPCELTIARRDGMPGARGGGKGENG